MTSHDLPWPPVTSRNLPKAGSKYFGGQGTFLFTLAPAFHVYRASALASNYCYFNPPKTGQLRGGLAPSAGTLSARLWE